MNNKIKIIELVILRPPFFRSFPRAMEWCAASPRSDGYPQAVIFDNFFPSFPCTVPELGLGDGVVRGVSIYYRRRHIIQYSHNVIYNIKCVPELGLGDGVVRGVARPEVQQPRRVQLHLLRNII